MKNQGRIFFGLLLAGAAIGAVACGDDDDTSTSSTTATATTASSSSSAASGGGSSGLTKCEQACTDLYNCGLEKDGAAQLCPGFKGGAEGDAFVNGSMDNGCAQACEDNMALASIVDKSNCKKTVDTLKTLNAQFKGVCEKGLTGGSGAGGGGGAGGGK